MAHSLPRIAASSLFLLVAYYAVPVSRSDSHTWLRIAATVATMCLAAWIIVRQVRRTVGEPDGPIAGLLQAIICGVLIFSLVDYIIATSMPGQFADLATKTDALYFALATVATVGFGDVHAVGQVARALLCVQQIFNLVIIGTAGSVLLTALRSRGSDGKG